MIGARLYYISTIEGNLGFYEKDAMEWGHFLLSRTDLS